MNGQAAIVTGGSRGIGLEIAGSLLATGVSVCITGRDANTLETAAARLDAGERLLTIAGAAHDPAHRHHVVSQVMACFGSLDVLINNAATNPQYGPLAEADLGAVRKVLDVNLVTPLAWTQLAWDTWMADHGGVIVNVASAGGIRPSRDIGSYNVSKAALSHMTRQLALELAPCVRVNAVAPAAVKTDFARALYEGREHEVASGYPLKRLGCPPDVAALVRFLASEESSWITGQTVVLDGGRLLT